MNREIQNLDQMISEVASGEKDTQRYQLKTESMMREIESSNYENVLKIHFLIDDLRISGDLSEEDAEAKKQELNTACQKLTGHTIDYLISCFYPAQNYEFKSIEQYAQLKPINAYFDDDYYINQINILSNDRALVKYRASAYADGPNERLCIIHNCSAEAPVFEEIENFNESRYFIATETIPLENGDIITLDNRGVPIISFKQNGQWEKEVLTEQYLFKEIIPLSPNKMVCVADNGIVEGIKGRDGKWKFEIKRGEDFQDWFVQLFIQDDGKKIYFYNGVAVALDHDYRVDRIIKVDESHQRVLGIFSDGRVLAWNDSQLFIYHLERSGDLLDELTYDPWFVDVDRTNFDTEIDFVKIINNNEFIVVTRNGEILSLKKTHREREEFSSSNIYSIDYRPVSAADTAVTADGKIYYAFDGLDQSKDAPNQIYVLGDGTQ